MLTAVPLALYARFNTDQEAAGKFIIQIVDKSEDLGDFSILHRWTEYGNTVLARAYNSSGGDYAETTSGYTVNTWHDACGIFASATDRRVFLDGGSKGTNATDITPIGLDRTCIGRAGDASPSGYFSGKVAEVAIWDLTNWPGATNADKADNFEKILPSLAKGFSPLFYPLGLKAYWPLIKDEDTDKVGGYDLTAYNSPGISAHPRVIMPVGFFPVPHTKTRLAGQSDITISCSGSLTVTKKKYLAGSSAVTISCAGTLTHKNRLAGQSSISIGTFGKLFTYQTFPTLSTSPRIESFIDEYSDETVIVDSYASGYPLINPQFDFDPGNFKPLLLHVSQADKDILSAFYNDHKEDIIRWFNEQDNSYYFVIFTGKPDCRLGDLKNEWDIEIPFRQVLET